MTVLAVHRQEPNWPADNGRPRYQVAYGGRDYWAETDGPEPTGDDVANVIEFGGVSLADIKAALAAKIDADAEEVRLRYITPGAGMAMTYQEKFAQAQAVSAMGEQTANAMTEAEQLEQFPTLAASVGIETATIHDCAALVLARYASFAALSHTIERTRLAGKAAVKSASTVQGVRAAYEAVAWPTP